jgi:predicted AAA+ superfamily ATPase
METVLFRYNPWWTSVFSQPGIIERPSLFREMTDQLKNREIVFLTGLRRIGKTTLMKLLVNHLIHAEGIDPGRIMYVSLDDYLLEKKSILEIIEEFRKIHHLKFNDFIYLFLDEVTYKQDFEVQLKNLYDNHSVKVFASSSGSSLLKNSKAYLTGRSRLVEVPPLVFSEYLEFKDILINPEDDHLSERYFEDFLQTGGIPEFVLNSETRYLQDLVDDIIYKDIAAMHGIRDIRTLKDYFLLLMERSGKVLSINKIASILSISPDTAKRYFDLFAGTYLIHTVDRYGKTNERILAPRKVYAADTGIRTFFTGFRDKGSLFENYVYLQLRKYHPEYIYQDGIEIDFLLERKTLIEVKFHQEELSPKQKALYDSFPAGEKMTIRSYKELDGWLKSSRQ